jgi:hypothetical protein
VVETIDDLLVRVPKSGPLEGAYLQEVFATALLLSDAKRIKRHGDALLRVDELNSSMTEAMPEIGSADDSAAMEIGGEPTGVDGDNFWPDENGVETDESAADDAAKLDEEPVSAGDFWF